MFSLLKNQASQVKEKRKVPKPKDPDEKFRDNIYRFALDNLKRKKKKSKKVLPDIYQHFKKIYETKHLEPMNKDVEKKTLSRSVFNLPIDVQSKVIKLMRLGTTHQEITKWLLVHMDHNIYELLNWRQISISSELESVLLNILENPERRFLGKKILILGNRLPENQNYGHWVCIVLDVKEKMISVFDSFGEDGLARYTLPEIPEFTYSLNYHAFQSDNTATCGFWYCAYIFFKQNIGALFDTFKIPFDKNIASTRYGNDVAVSQFWLSKFNDKVFKYKVPDYFKNIYATKMEVEEPEPKKARIGLDNEDVLTKEMDTSEPLELMDTSEPFESKSEDEMELE